MNGNAKRVYCVLCVAQSDRCYMDKKRNTTHNSHNTIRIYIQYIHTYKLSQWDYVVQLNEFLKSEPKTHWGGNASTN